MTPSAATRPAALLAFATSPSASVSAFLHSIMPSPVRWRSSITVLAEISAMFACSIVIDGTGRLNHVPTISMRPTRAWRWVGQETLAPALLGIRSGRGFVGDFDELIARGDD